MNIFVSVFNFCFQIRWHKSINTKLKSKMSFFISIENRMDEWHTDLFEEYHLSSYSFDSCLVRSKICRFDFSNGFWFPKFVRLISQISAFLISKICTFDFGPCTVRPIQFSIFSQSLKNHILCTFKGLLLIFELAI